MAVNLRLVQTYMGAPRLKGVSLGSACGRQTNQPLSGEFEVAALLCGGLHDRLPVPLQQHHKLGVWQVAQGDAQQAFW